MSKYVDKLDKILRQLSIGERRLIVLQVAQPIEHIEGSMEPVILELSEEDKAARVAIHEALAITDADQVVEVVRHCSKEKYDELLQSGEAHKVISVSHRA